jgi:TPP-dependent pyruvate/acetoin dehydrogenase alpha subunit
MGNRNTGKSESRNGASPVAEEKFSLISDTKLIGLYTNLLKFRQIGGQGRNPNGANSKSASLAAWGHEAAVVGTAIDLGPGDVVCSLDLEVLAGISEGDAIEKLISDSSRNERNGSRGTRKTAGPNGHAGTPFAHAVIGTALARKTANNGKVAVAYCNGKDAGSLRETIHIATIHALPIIFVHQLDGSAGRLTKDPHTPRPKKDQAGETPWYPSIAVDTDDVVAVYRVAFESISRARLGRGPTLIECLALRASIGSKNGNGRHTGDAVASMEHYLRAKGLFDPKLKRAAIADTQNR